MKTQKSAVEKLIGALKNMNIYDSNVSATPEGDVYHHKHFKNKYSHTPFWLKVLFENAAKEVTGFELSIQFHTTVDGKPHSFVFHRAQYKGEKDGAIHYRVLYKF